MEFTFSPALMKLVQEGAVKNVDNEDFCFISSKEDKELVSAIQVMESMGIRELEIDLSSDDSNLLH
jgi:hypothetical protein